MDELTDRSARISQGSFVVRVFLAGVFVCAAAVLCGRLMIGVWPPQTLSVESLMGTAFLGSSLLLLLTSLLLHRALGAVRREYQNLFRRRMLAAVVAATLFFSVQAYGLWCLQVLLDPQRAAVGAMSFAFVFTALHAMHVVVAMMFLIYVTARSLNGRYDHEYYWGVTVCIWFWDVLGVVWIAILGVLVISSLSGLVGTIKPFPAA